MAEFPPTAEQQAAVDAFTAGGTLAITAGAGTGKTSTLGMVAESRPDSRGLYVAFNKAVQLEAEASFPANVTSKTAHALAYRTHGAPLRARMQGQRMSSASVAQVLALRSPVMLDGADGRAVVQPAQQAALALSVVARYCRSADRRIAGQHFVPPEGTEGVDLSELRRVVVAAADRAWADLSGPNGRLKPTHDHYLRQWALTDPKLAFDFILYDEAQDADPCVAGVLLRQNAQLVAVGDRAQALYQWRGNADILSTLAADHRVSLTQSWRFGRAVAAEANLWLAVLGDDLRITGAPRRDSRLAPLDTPDAVLCRSNAGAVRTVMEAHDAGRNPALVGGGSRDSPPRRGRPATASRPALRPPRARRLRHLGWRRRLRPQRSRRHRPGDRREAHRTLRRRRGHRRHWFCHPRGAGRHRRVHSPQGQGPGVGRGANRYRLQRTHRAPRRGGDGVADRSHARLRRRHPGQDGARHGRACMGPRLRR